MLTWQEFDFFGSSFCNFAVAITVIIQTAVGINANAFLFPSLNVPPFPLCQYNDMAKLPLFLSLVVTSLLNVSLAAVSSCNYPPWLSCHKLAVAFSCCCAAKAIDNAVTPALQCCPCAVVSTCLLLLPFSPVNCYL